MGNTGSTRVAAREVAARIPTPPENGVTVSWALWPPGLIDNPKRWAAWMAVTATAETIKPSRNNDIDNIYESPPFYWQALTPTQTLCDTGRNVVRHRHSTGRTTGRIQMQPDQHISVFYKARNPSTDMV